jgi:hypothetical protein
MGRIDHIIAFPDFFAPPVDLGRWDDLVVQNLGLVFTQKLERSCWTGQLRRCTPYWSGGA